MRLKSLAKDYKLFANLVVLGAIVISFVAILFSYQNFTKDSNKNIVNSAAKIDREISESFSYVENISSFIANQILSKDNPTKESIAAVLLNSKPRIDETQYNIFTWTLFDFIDSKNYVIASSLHGILKNPVLVTKEKRSWIVDAKLTPGKILLSKIDIGIISKEQIIPVGFGMTKKNGDFFGIISFGINVEKFKKKLELIPTSPDIIFAILDKNKSIIFLSENFPTDQNLILSKELPKLTSPGFLEIGGRDFYFKPNTNYPVSVLVGVNQKMFLSRFRNDFLPKVLNTIYLTIFFLTLLHFFRVKLLNPILNLSESANQISQGNTNIYVPQSDITEINSLSNSIEMVRDFVEKQKDEKLRLAQEKLIAERENHNKTEFLSSTVHELKNIVAGIVGLAEIVRTNFSDKITSKDKSFSSKEISQNQTFLEDIVNLGEELSEFIHDIMDINQARTGDFKIDEKPQVNMQDIVLRSIKLLKIRAIKNRKTIVSNFIKHDDEDFMVNNLDPRRVKQIIVNLISNSIKYGDDDTKIEVSLEKIGADAIISLRDSMIDHVKQNPEIDKELKSHLTSLLKKSRPSIIITIKDSGAGMSEDEIHIALKKYGRIKNKRDEFIDSTGLGLPIVKHLVEMQGGMMVISSEKEVGTEVRIIF